MKSVISLPLIETIEPSSVDEVARTVRAACESGTAIYPLGGGTSLDYGLPVTRQGWGLALRGLSGVIDYPARDMTITVEAGITMEALAETLASERQFLPIDVPDPQQATLGGVVATNSNGPRRYGLGTLRDYVIGIQAVDGSGRKFRGGGRVVKNVAGYDFCKLLTGSLGTLGVITQLTLKLKPVPTATSLLLTSVPDLVAAERLLAALVNTQTTPTAIELLAGPQWREEPLIANHLPEASPRPVCLAVGLEGSQIEVDWMLEQLAVEWHEQGVRHPHSVRGAEAHRLWELLAAFPAAGSSALTLKASVLPSGTTALIEAVWAVDPQASIQAHAGNGIVIARFPEFPEAGLSRSLIGHLQPIAARHGGNIIVLSNPSAAEMTHQAAWGGIDAPFDLMSQIKRQFDPKHILNPGRFVY